MARLGNPLGVEKGLVEPSPEAHANEALYIARTLLRDSRKVTVRALNATRRDRKLRKRSHLAH
jgi:hypothetical protein